MPTRQSRENGAERNAVPWLLLAPAVALVGVLAVSMGALVDDSLRAFDRNTFRLGGELTLANYSRAATSAGFFPVTARTVAGAAAATLLTLAFAAPYAYCLVRTSSAALRKAMLFCLFMPFFIGQVVRAYSWLVLLGKRGVVNETIQAFGLPALDLLYNFNAVVFGLSQYLIPTAVLMMAPALAAAGREFEDASTNLGASWPRTIVHVILPMASPGLVAAAAVVFTISLTDFTMPAMLGAGRADFLANFIYAAYFEMTEPGLGAALAVALTLLGSALLIALLLLASRLGPMSGRLSGARR